MHLFSLALAALALLTAPAPAAPPWAADLIPGGCPGGRCLLQRPAPAPQAAPVPEAVPRPAPATVAVPARVAQSPARVAVPSAPERRGLFRRVADAIRDRRAGR